MLADFFWPILMLLALVALLFSGYPVAFVLAGVGIGFAVLLAILNALWGENEEARAAALEQARAQAGAGKLPPAG